MRNINKAMIAAVAVCSLSSVASAASAASAANEPTIGVVVPTLDSDFWNRYVTFVKTGASQLGVNVIILNADNKPDQMIRSVQDLIARKVNGIISVGYWDTAPPTIRFAERENIPVVITDTYPAFSPESKNHPNYIAFIGPGDFDAGYHIGKALLAAIKPGPDGKKVIGVVNGTPGTSVAIDRRAGLAKAIKEDGNVEIAGEVNGNFVSDQAQTAFESLYQGHPEIAGVWSANDPMAIGVIAALKNRGKVPGKDVIIASQDLNPPDVQAVKDGEQLYDIGGHWVQGGIALVIMYDYLHGYKVPADKTTIKLNMLPMTQAQVPLYLKYFPGGQPNYDFKAHSKVYNKDAPPSPAFNLQYSYSQ
jgi:ABC-type sugar transport system substrate-binding protein